jgi:hypothetical protein
MPIPCDPANEEDEEFITIKEKEVKVKKRNRNSPNN